MARNLLPPLSMTGEWITLNEAAERTGLSTRTLRRYIDDGELPSEIRKVGRKPIRFVLADALPNGKAQPPAEPAGLADEIRKLRHAIDRLAERLQ